MVHNRAEHAHRTPPRSIDNDDRKAVSEHRDSTRGDFTAGRDTSGRREGYLPFPDVARRNAAQERLEVPALVRSLAIPSGARILELGCGRGVALVPLAQLCEPRQLTGVDIDPRVLLEARGRLDARGVEAELVCADIRELPFADGSFDLAVDFGTCYHISRPELALREVARVLRRDGALFVHETPISQLLAHPVRSAGRRLPWSAVPELCGHRTAVLWSSRITVPTNAGPDRLAALRTRAQPQAQRPAD